MSDIKLYVVLPGMVVKLDNSGKTYGEGEKLELSESAELTQEFLKGDAIAPFLEDDELEDVTVTQEFLDANPGYVAEIGAVVKFPKVKLDEEKAAEEKAAEEKAQADLEEQAKASEQAAAENVVPAATDEEMKALDTSGEPKLRYRGHVVIAEGSREVNGKVFKTVRLDDGTTEDLDDVEYRNGVKMSYPADHSIQE